VLYFIPSICFKGDGLLVVCLAIKSWKHAQHGMPSRNLTILFYYFDRFRLDPFILSHSLV
jgi:hypothetical protein